MRCSEVEGGSRRPRIAHVAAIAPSLRHLLLGQMRSQKDAGYEVTAISAGGPDVGAIREAGIAHVAVEIPRRIDPAGDLGACVQLYRALRDRRPDLVHTHFSKPGVLGAIAARAAGVPVIVHTFHGLFVHERMSRAERESFLMVERLASLSRASVLCQNEEDARLVVEQRVCPASRVRHIGNGIDLRRFDPRDSARERIRIRSEVGLPEGAKVIGFVGRLNARRKGFTDLLAAVALLVAKDPAVRLLVAGEPDRALGDAVEPSAARAHGIERQCVFLGWQPPERMPALYASMDVLALPSILEGLPRSVMEASAMGVPVVASDVKGNREVVFDGRTGLLSPYGDVAALAESLGRILGDPSLGASMGRRGVEVAKERFDEQGMCGRILAEYARLLGPRERGF